MKQNENYDRRDDLLHRRTSERCLISLTIFPLLASLRWALGLQSVHPTIERDLCRAAVLLRFASLSPEYEPEINIQSSQ